MGIRALLAGTFIAIAALGVAAHAQDHDIHDICLDVPMVYVHDDPTIDSTLCVPWPLD